MKIISLLFTFTLLFILLVLMQSVFNPLFLWEELIYHFETFDLRGLAKGSIYLGTYLLAVIPFIIVVGVRSFKLFSLLSFIIFIFLSMDFFIQFLGVTHGFSLAEYALGINEMGNYKYLIVYTDTILKAMLLASVFIFILYIVRVKVCRIRLDAKYLLLILLPTSIIYGGCHRIDTFKLSSYPAALKFPAIAVEHLGRTTPMVDRILNDDIEVESAGKFKNIVWIIDESITGTYLSVNGYSKDTTPYLKSLEQETKKFSNFGVVNSISNCSGTSNLFLRVGLNPNTNDNAKDALSNIPTIFQYAKRAGYKTWLMDSQTRKDHLQNYLTLYDRDDIDHFETLGPEVTRVDRDKEFLNTLSTIVNNKKSNDKNFIVLVKYGAHFPYLLTYEQQNSPFTPVLGSSYGGMDMEHKEEQVNTYLNSLYFNTDLYLKELIEKVDLSQSVVFYTSDHGQNILEEASLSRPHCNTEIVVKNEVSVPLMVFNDDAESIFPSDKNLFYSQIQMFPTTLSLLGYKKELVAKYGKTLAEGFKTSEERKYILSSSFEVKAYK